MNLKYDKELLIEAMNSGCKTAAQLAQFLKIKTTEQSYIPAQTKVEW